MTAKSLFPVKGINEFIVQVDYIGGIAKEHDVDVMITDPIMGWRFAFESLGYRSVVQTESGIKPKMISIQQTGERRTWLLEGTIIHKSIMLYVIPIEKEVLERCDHYCFGTGLVLIKNNQLLTKELMKQLIIVL